MRTDGTDHQRGRDPASRQGTRFGDFLAARERFFEGLRRDSEFRRLETTWALPARDRAGDRRG